VTLTADTSGPACAVAAPAPDLDYDLARAVARTVVKRRAGDFAGFPDWDRDDLEQEALLAVHRAWPKYSPDKSAASTFIYTVAVRRLLNLARELRRRLRRDRLMMSMTPPVAARTTPGN
jgi:DNA-directed RNA polymerase specialized sigma24 family protein